MTLRIDDPGPACTVQDLGRPGLARLGVGRSGAADRSALIAANRLVGNADGAAALEVTLGGLRVTALAGCVVAVGGAAVPITVRGADASRSEPGPVVQLAAGDQLRLGRPHHGLRSYLAVHGGFDVPEVLGSRSTDTLSGLGPLPVAAGDELPVGRVRGGSRLPEPDFDHENLHQLCGVSRAFVGVSRADSHDRNAAAPTDPDDPPRLDLILGPRDDWFTDAAMETLVTSEWLVGRNTDRVGMQLDGPALERRITTELPSEGMVPGAIQVPLSGRPVVFLADHPVTGGYPVIAVLSTAAVDLAAQLRPGRRSGFDGFRLLGADGRGLRSRAHRRRHVRTRRCTRWAGSPATAPIPRACTPATPRSRCPAPTAGAVGLQRKARCRHRARPGVEHPGAGPRAPCGNGAVVAATAAGAAAGRCAAGRTVEPRPGRRLERRSRTVRRVPGSAAVGAGDRRRQPDDRRRGPPVRRDAHRHRRPPTRCAGRLFPADRSDRAAGHRPADLLRTT